MGPLSVPVPHCDSVSSSGKWGHMQPSAKCLENGQYILGCPLHSPSSTTVHSCLDLFGEHTHTQAIPLRQPVSSLQDQERPTEGQVPPWAGLTEARVGRLVLLGGRGSHLHWVPRPLLLAGWSSPFLSLSCIMGGRGIPPPCLTPSPSVQVGGHLDVPEGSCGDSKMQILPRNTERLSLKHSAAATGLWVACPGPTSLYCLLLELSLQQQHLPLLVTAPLAADTSRRPPQGGCKEDMRASDSSSCT